MKGDLHPAAMRLSAALPSTTHVQQFGEHAARNSVNNFKRVIIDGVQYDSITEASRQLRKCREIIRKMIIRGEARYA